MHRFAGHARLAGQGIVRTPHAFVGPKASRIRSLAVPVNKRSSVDPLLGIAPPAPPRAQPEGANGVESALPNFLAGTSRPNNPNDLTELLRGNKVTGNQRGGNAQAQNRSRTAAAIGAMRRGSGSTIPTQDLEDAFLPPNVPEPMLEQESEAGANVNPTPVDREHPHPIDAIYGRNDLDERILAAARALHHSRVNNSALAGQVSSLSSLLDGFSKRSEQTLSVELPNESQPKESRRVPVTSATSSEAELSERTDDGVLLIAYVTGLEGERGQERISVCSGFAVEGGERLEEGEGKGTGALVVTCAHTLRGSLPTRPRGVEGDASEESSVALAITRSGHILPITTLLSSLPTSDLILLQLGDKAIVVDENSSLGGPLITSPVKVRTLPVSPYPAPTGAELCVSSFWGWEDDAGSTLPAFEFQSKAESGSNNGLQIAFDSPAVLTISSHTLPPPTGREKETVKRERDDAGRSRWGRARLVEYRDLSGREAKTGTYDELAQLDFKLLADNTHNPPALQQKGQGVAAFPPPGSSGGPIVDATSGAVVGVTRGTKMSQLQGSRGDGIPAEKVFFFFALPGFPRK